MKYTIYKGMATALVTPMHHDGSVDFDAYGRLIDWQISEGIHALVAVGTTGESATLSDAQRLEVIRFTIERAAGRVPVIAGTGSNDTAHAIESTKAACAVGADAVLVVTPYYNKATQSGLKAHFTAIAEASTVPVVLYNVPSRTGCNLLPDTVAALAEHPNIVAIKEASGNMSQVVELFAKCGDKLDIYSGEDALTVPFISMGGAGTISVLSNVAPKLAAEMADKALSGDFTAAAALQCRLLPLTNALFSQVSPIPAKAALSAMGFGADCLRLPLTPMEEPYRSRMLSEMRKLGIEV